jgi:hypothetical protein
MEDDEVPFRVSIKQSSTRKLRKLPIDEQEIGQETALLQPNKRGRPFIKIEEVKKDIRNRSNNFS